MSLLPRSSFFDTDRFLNNFWAPMSGEPETAGSFFTPRVDIRDKDDHYEITAELPGVDKNDINVTLVNGILTLEAETHKEDKQEEDGKLIRHERRFGKFMRSFNLGGDVQEGDISANFKDGVLWLKAPKREEAIPTQRRIEIN